MIKLYFFADYFHYPYPAQAQPPLSAHCTSSAEEVYKSDGVPVPSISLLAKITDLCH